MRLSLETDNRTKFLGSCFVAALLPTFLIYASMTLRRRRISTKATTLHVAVVGSGAIGTFIGLRLRSVVSGVSLVGRSSLQQALKASHNVLTILEKSGTTTNYRVGEEGLNVLLDDDWRSLSDHQVILVTVKTVATRAIGVSLAATLPRDSQALLVSLQNGVHNAKILRECLSSTHPYVTILTGVVAFAVEWVPKTSTFCSTVPGKIYIERPRDTSAAAITTSLAQSLSTAGVPTQIREQHAMQPIVVTKLLINATLNPVNALAGVPIPVMLADRGYRRIVAALLCEGSDALGLSVVVKLLATVVEALPGWLFRALLHPDYKSSMLQDIERGRKTTEVEDFNGEICRRGHAPLHSAVLSLVKVLEKERSFLSSSEDLLFKLGL